MGTSGESQPPRVGLQLKPRMLSGAVAHALRAHGMVAVDLTEEPEVTAPPLDVALVSDEASLSVPADVVITLPDDSTLPAVLALLEKALPPRRDEETPGA